MITNTPTCSDKEKNRILTIIGEGRGLMEIAPIKIFSTSKGGCTWLYSNIEGFLCYVIDYNDKTFYFIVYDFITYEKLFQFELYENFQKYYSVLALDFHCFETQQCFFGLNFINKEEAAVFQRRVKMIDLNMKNELLKMSNVNVRLSTCIIKMASESIIYLKEKFLKTDIFFNSELTESMKESIDLCKPNYFDILNNIIYDNKNKSFKVDKISSNMKILCRNAGVNKLLLKNDSLGLNFFKNISKYYDQYYFKQIDNAKLIKIDSKVFFEKPDEIFSLNYIKSLSIPKVIPIPKIPTIQSTEKSNVINTSHKESITSNNSQSSTTSTNSAFSLTEKTPIKTPPKKDLAREEPSKSQMQMQIQQTIEDMKKKKENDSSALDRDSGNKIKIIPPKKENAKKEPSKSLLQIQTEMRIEDMKKIKQNDSSGSDSDSW